MGNTQGSERGNEAFIRRITKLGVSSVNEKLLSLRFFASDHALVTSEQIILFCESGGVELLLDIVSMPHEEMQKLSAQVCAKIVHTAGGRSQILNNGGVKAFVKVLKFESPSEDLISGALRVLKFLLTSEEGNQLFCDAQGVNVVFQLLANRSAAIRVLATGFIVFLAEDGANRSVIASAGGIKILLAKLRDSEEKVRLQVATALVVFSADEKGREMVCDESGASSLLFALDDARNSLLRQRITEVLAYISLNKKSWVTLRVTQKLQSLLVLLRQDPDLVVKGHLAIIVAHLARDLKIRTSMYRKNVAISLAALMNSGDISVSQHAKKALDAVEKGVFKNMLPERPVKSRSSPVRAKTDKKKASSRVRPPSTSTSGGAAKSGPVGGGAPARQEARSSSQEKKAAVDEKLPPKIEKYTTGFVNTGRCRIGGSSFCSGVFRRESDDTVWLGKCNVLYSEITSELDGWREARASGFFSYFNVPVPRTVLARMPIILPEGIKNVTEIGLDRSRTHVFYLMSEIISNFSTFGEIPEFDDPNDLYVYVPGSGKVKIRGVGHIMAVAKVAADYDLFGGSGGNIGIQVVDGVANCFKIDPGYAFCRVPELKVGPREIRVATQAENAVIQYDDLPKSVRDEFIEALKSIIETPSAVFEGFFHRDELSRFLDCEAGKELLSTPEFLRQRIAELKQAFRSELSAWIPREACYSVIQRKRVTERDITATITLTMAASNRRNKRTSRSSTKSTTYLIPYEHLTCGEVIGKGSFAKVIKGSWRGVPVAIKELLAQELTEDAVDELRHESDIMNQLRHPNVMTMYGICMKPLSLVLELISLGSLYKMIHDDGQLIGWSLRWQIACGVVRALGYLHDFTPTILHRDLKSLNVMMRTRSIPVLTDFGLSKVKSETKTTLGLTDDKVGTLAWMGPELFSDKPSTKATDVFALAIILWELASREVPWVNLPNMYLIYAKVSAGERVKIPEHTPPIYAELIRSCWAQAPEKRPSVDAVLRTLEGAEAEIAQFI